jgi:hypothetical protein
VVRVLRAEHGVVSREYEESRCSVCDRRCGSSGVCSGCDDRYDDYPDDPDETPVALGADARALVAALVADGVEHTVRQYPGRRVRIRVSAAERDRVAEIACARIGLSFQCVCDGWICTTEAA